MVSDFTGNRENLFVVECSAITDEALIYLQGSNDGTVWANIATIILTSTATQWVSFDERWISYRYLSTITTSATYNAYVVDARANNLIYMNAAANLFLMHMGCIHG